MNKEKLVPILEALTIIEGDFSVPKNIRTRVKNAITALEETNEQPQIKIDKALQELSEADNEPNLSQYTRTQIWNVVSALECK